MKKVASLLIFAVLVLLGFGIVMVLSTSSIEAMSNYNTPHYFLQHQLLWIGIGICAFITALILNYRYWKSLAVPFFCLTIILLIAVLIPNIGSKFGGSRRWLNILGISIQPSEPAKFAIVLMLSWWIAREQRHLTSFRKGTLIPLFFIGTVALLIFVEPDYGTAFLIGIIGLTIVYLSGAKLLHILSLAVPALGLFVFALITNPERMSRISAFLTPEEYSDTDAFQLINALKAFKEGKLWGVGLGESMQKHFYLPEAHTDFIFPIIGEELGIIATISILLLFMTFFLCGLIISKNADELFGKTLSFGITLVITLQAILNIAVVTGCLPTTGMTLPFISFGGSSMVISLFQVGILVNISLNSQNSHNQTSLESDDWLFSE
jgi:cell division protein FtsW